MRMFLYFTEYQKYQDMVLMVRVCVCVFTVSLFSHSIRMGLKFSIILYVGFGIQLDKLSFIILMR